MRETQAASCEDLHRVEERLRECDKSVERFFDLRIASNERLSQERYGEIRRRLDDLNNSHEKAVNEKQRTDEAALRVQERSVTKEELQTWKDEVNRALSLAQGAATARATMMSVAVGMAVLIINVVIRYLGK